MSKPLISFLVAIFFLANPIQTFATTTAQPSLAEKAVAQKATTAAVAQKATTAAVAQKAATAAAIQKAPTTSAKPSPPSTSQTSSSASSTQSRSQQPAGGGSTSAEMVNKINKPTTGSSESGAIHPSANPGGPSDLNNGYIVPGPTSSQ